MGNAASFKKSAVNAINFNNKVAYNQTKGVLAAAKGAFKMTQGAFTFNASTIKEGARTVAKGFANATPLIAFTRVGVKEKTGRDYVKVGIDKAADLGTGAFIDSWADEYQHVMKDPLHNMPVIGNVTDMIEGATPKQKLKNKIGRLLTVGKVALQMMPGMTLSQKAAALMGRILLVATAETIAREAIKTIGTKLMNTGCKDRAELNELIDQIPDEYVKVILYGLSTNPATAQY